MAHFRYIIQFVEEAEDLENAANRILHELTGLKNIYFEEIKTFGKVNRDPVERILSICFFALININEHNQNSVIAHDSYWVDLKEIPTLVFDHNNMVDFALKQLRYKAALHPIGFELLPDKFTIPQLQKLYETIYGSQFDRRNFSRKILSTKLLIDSGEKDHQSNHKKAILYKLNKEEYERQLNSLQYFLPLKK